MTDLTDKQLAVLNLIRHGLEQDGAPPTRREIAEKLNRDVKSVAQHLQRLERKGYISRQPWKSRNIRLTDKGRISRGARGIPLVGQVAAGQPILAEENLENRVDIGDFFGSKGDFFFLRVKGESMKHAGIRHGDLVAVLTEKEVKDGAIGVALIGDEVTVKRIYRNGRFLELKPENPEFESVVIDSSQEPVRVVGPVIGLMRRL